MNFRQLINLFREPSIKSFWWLTWDLTQGAGAAIPTTVEVFLHHRFGARSGVAMAKGFILLAIVVLSSPPNQPVLIPLFPAFVIGYAIVASGQWFTGRFGIPAGEVHSHSMGEPWPIWQRVPVTATTVDRYFEPIVCWIFAGIVSALDPWFSNWLVIAGAGLLIKGQWDRIETRTRHLNALDGRAESQRLAPRTRPENEPFVEARPAPPRPQRQRQ
jgi:hypothetical protein